MAELGTRSATERAGPVTLHLAALAELIRDGLLPVTHGAFSFDGHDYFPPFLPVFMASVRMSTTS